MTPGGAAGGGAGLLRVLDALGFAARAHADQRRKGAAQQPYVNHVIEVAELVGVATSGTDPDLVAAALLHDVIEDTDHAAAEIEARFGVRVARIVVANSDDMTLPKEERRRRRIAGQAHKSPEARIVKTADVISNLRAIETSPPAGWGLERKLGYLGGCRDLIDAGRGANAALEALFDETIAATERSLRATGAASPEGTGTLAATLSLAAAQPVHLVYLPNTERRAIGPAEVDRLCTIIAETFPSATVQPAEAVYDGLRRPILLARIRSDSTEGIVALAQRLCLDFAERFVGIEVDGRYLRVYGDDTA